MSIAGKNCWLRDPQHLDVPLNPVVCFRREFDLSGAGEVKITVAALGVFDLYLDGEHLTGEELFAPGWHDYRFRTGKRSYAVELKPGTHTVSVLLGSGWYDGKIAGEDRKNPALFIELYLPDGQTVSGDALWQCANDGPYIYSDIYDGEKYDANRQWQNWHMPELCCFDVALEEPSAEFVCKIKRYLPQSISNGIVDFGANITGREVLRFTAPQGTVITLRHAEVLDSDGSLYTENLRASRSCNIVIATGKAQVYEPLFTFHGFRYLEVSGVEDFEVEAWSVRSGYKMHLEFDSSSALLNQLVRNISLGWQDNSLAVPTDCPQRDERVGWLGDAQVFIKAASYLSDCTAFFRNWLKDVRLHCSPEGEYPIVAPFLTRFEFYNVAGWSDAGVICPWVLYEFTGNLEILRENYPAVRAFTLLRRRNFEAGTLPEARFGDWLNLDDPTSQELIGCAYLCYSTELAARCAAELGESADQQEFESFLAEYKQYYRKNLFPGMVSQTAFAHAICFGLLEDEQLPGVVDALVKHIREKRNTHLATGFLGTPYLLHALSRHGHAALAWELLEQTTYPSWFFPVLNGATTMWEHWDSWTPERGFKDPKMNSFNHYAYGAVLDWIVGFAAGIKPDMDIDPHPGGTLEYMNVTFKGLSVRWEKAATGTYRCTITVPENISASFRGEKLSPGVHDFTL
ncbi:MAG: family 78 glycoside hydrolase catalytic domain [Lentisphaeria bacterium]|nr:family 78 glycoside hydrolase catalytic domain [Lentisphaeria bacterium]